MIVLIIFTPFIDYYCKKNVFCSFLFEHHDQHDNISLTNDMSLWLFVQPNADEGVFGKYMFETAIVLI